jgi:glutamyl/glutaminyl-tRNA synthetase
MLFAPALARLRAIDVPVLTRFAPAPTGDLHLGHVVNAIFVWGLARAAGGEVLLRIEDHDRQRSRPAYEAGILDDLDWLGFEADRHPTSEYRDPDAPGRQSARDAVYRAALAPLLARGMVYGCRCSRADLAAPAHGGAAPPGAERRYPGTCRDLGIDAGEGVAWRLRFEPGDETFDDLLMGPQRQDPAAQCGDLLLRDRLGNWTYQCVASIDDTVQGISAVIRGADLLESTGRQIRLARLIGREQPALFAHHPLVMKSSTQKLSKSDRDSGIRDLRAAGWSPEAVVGDAASRVGLAAPGTRIPAREVVRLFAGDA